MTSLDDTIRAIVREAVRAELASALDSLKAEIRAARGSEPASRYVTTDAAAEYAGVTAATIREWIKAGRLPEYRVGRSLRVRRADLDALLAPKDDVERAVVLELRRLDEESR